MTLDLESSMAMRWMTEDTPDRAGELEIRVFDGGQFGIVAYDSVPRWIAADVGDLKLSDSVVFESDQLDGQYHLQLSPDQLPIWNDYVRHARQWSVDCDTLFVIYGPLPRTSSIYAINLCIDEQTHGQAVFLPDSLTSLPFFELTSSIDEVERLTNINFFGDLLDAESEAYIEHNHHRLRWLYPESFYKLRIEENNQYRYANQ